MLNNLINIYDILEFARVIRRSPKFILKAFSKLYSSRDGKVKSAWIHTDAPPLYWGNIPEVVERWNLLMTGDAKKEYYEYFAEKYLPDSNVYKALSLGCGTGYRELRWAETRKFESIDAYDLSEQRINHAVKNAEHRGITNIRYKAGDIYCVEFPEDYYDLILGEQSLHHFTPLEELIIKLKKSLKPDGYFLINEFVGPNRFQWRNEQLKAANDNLARLPDNYKKYWKSNSIKKRIYKPSYLRMKLNDPSEAIESENILPIMNKHFELVELKNWGGTILQILFDKIAHNFINDRMETKKILRETFAAEDKLMANGSLKSDFVFAVYRKKF